MTQDRPNSESSSAFLSTRAVASLVEVALREAIAARGQMTNLHLRDAALEIELFADKVLGAFSHCEYGRPIPGDVVRELRSAEIVDGEALMTQLMSAPDVHREQLDFACLSDYLRLRLLAEYDAGSGAQTP
jgi:hypothetical protein